MRLFYLFTDYGAGSIRLEKETNSIDVAQRWVERDELYNYYQEVTDEELTLANRKSRRARKIA